MSSSPIAPARVRNHDNPTLHPKTDTNENCAPKHLLAPASRPARVASRNMPVTMTPWMTTASKIIPMIEMAEALGLRRGYEMMEDMRSLPMDGVRLHALKERV